MTKNKGFTPILILVIILIIAGFVGVYYLGTLQGKLSVVTPTPEVMVENPSLSPEKMTPGIFGWKNYENTDFGIEFAIPEEDFVTEESREKIFIGYKEPQYVPYVVITKETNLDIDAIEKCGDIIDLQNRDDFPCKKEDSSELFVGGKLAKRVDIYKGAFENSYRIVQFVNDSLQLEFYTTPDRFLAASDYTLDTFKFTQ